jgi:hypothetical protein
MFSHGGKQKTPTLSPLRCAKGLRQNPATNRHHRNRSMFYESAELVIEVNFVKRARSKLKVEKKFISAGGERDQHFRLQFTLGRAPTRNSSFFGLSQAFSISARAKSQIKGHTFLASGTWLDQTFPRN